MPPKLLTTLFFVCTDGAGSTSPGSPYEMKWSDEHGNIHVRKVPRPAVISKFFQFVNAVDIHNHLRQSCLKLEKKWVTMDCWFRLTTTLFGMSVVDTYRLCQFHGFLPRGRMSSLVMDEIDQDGVNELTMKKFAGILATQLIYKACNLRVDDLNMFDEDGMNEPGDSIMSGRRGRGNGGGNGDGDGNGDGGRSSRHSRTTGFESSRGGGRSPSCTTIPGFISGKTNANVRYCVGENEGDYGNTYRGHQDVSTVSLSNLRSIGSDTITTIDDGTHDESFEFEDDTQEGFNYTFRNIQRARKNAIDTMIDASMRKHSAVKLKCTTSNGKSTKGKKYVKPRKCVGCGALSRIKCLECDEVYCYPIKKQYDPSKSCFCRHINAISSPIERMIKRSKKTSGFFTP